MDEPCIHYSKWSKPVIERQMLWDSTHMRYLEWSDSERQKVEWHSPESGGQEGMGSQCSVGTELQFTRRRVLDGWWLRWCTNVKELVPHLKMGKKVNSVVMCILPRIFLKIKNRIIIISKNYIFEFMVYYGSSEWWGVREESIGGQPVGSQQIWKWAPHFHPDVCVFEGLSTREWRVLPQSSFRTRK